jgi:putative PIN family toxin of toxin-antitoxin system
MIYLQAAIRHGGPAAAVLRWCESGQITFFVSEDILNEVRDVLLRPEVRRKNRNLTQERVEEFLAHLSEKAVLVTEVPSLFSYERDPKDEKYVNLAVATHAQYLVSRDKDLLDLMNDPDFRQRFPHLTILDPPAFLRALSSQGSESR